MTVDGAIMEDDKGLYCGTAGAYFQDKETLVEHYKSEFHRYNLKRKIAGLPPVSKEWYDARKSQLLSSLNTSGKHVWVDPLTGKRFATENTYLAYTRSKKYQELVRKSGVPAPSPVVSAARAAASELAAARPAAPPGHTSKPLSRPVGSELSDEEEDGTLSSDASEWATDDEAEEETQAEAGAEAPANGEDWEEWDVCRSLFDNVVSASMEENLEYMFKAFGFYLPDAEYLADPEGLLRYLGAKLQYGHVPLYAPGDDPEARQFRSLHAVQRHMVDIVRCKMLYDGNEDEYADYYAYPEDEEDDERALALVNDPEASGPAEYELGVPLAGGGTRFLGAREFARYYRQRHRAGDRRQALSRVAAVLAQYRKMDVPLLLARTPAQVERRKAQQTENRHRARQQLALGQARNINDKLPKNVPY